MMVNWVAVVAAVKAERAGTSGAAVKADRAGASGASGFLKSFLLHPGTSMGRVSMVWVCLAE